MNMKTTKHFLALALIAASIIISFAGKPQTIKVELADMIIGKINTDVALTDSQKVQLKKQFIKYVNKVEVAHGKSDENEAINLKQQAFDEYQLSIDSILTPSQNTQLKQKNNERKNKK